MHQTTKGNEWYFRMKIHTGADAGNGYVHTITGTSANMHDVLETSKLLREDDYVMYGDFGYLGAPERPEIKEDEVLSKIEFRINKCPSSLKMADNFIICQCQPSDVYQDRSNPRLYCRYDIRAPWYEDKVYARASILRKHSINNCWLS